MRRRYALQISERGIDKGFAQYYPEHGFNYTRDVEKATIFATADEAVDALQERAKTYPEIARATQARLVIVRSGVTVLETLDGLVL